jgi:hypothetical protein
VDLVGPAAVRLMRAICRQMALMAGCGLGRAPAGYPQGMTEQPDPVGPVGHDEIVEERPSIRLSVVRVVNGIISVATGLFAAVLAVHIILIVGEANMGNPFAQFVDNWANAVNLGLTNLFTLTDEKAQIALNEGIAALLWLIIGAAATTIIARVLLPDAGTRVWYRRGVR